MKRRWPSNAKFVAVYFFLFDWSGWLYDHCMYALMKMGMEG